MKRPVIGDFPVTGRFSCGAKMILIFTVSIVENRTGK